MPDIVDPQTRSRMMSGIRARDTRPEMLIRRHLHRAGFRYRLHNAQLPGRPDLTFPKYRAVILVQGCFWHAHDGCRYYRLPASRQEFWEEKLLSNRDRDARNVARLEELGWRVAIVWECYTRRRDADLICLEKWLTGSSATLELSATAAGSHSVGGSDRAEDEALP